MKKTPTIIAIVLVFVAASIYIYNNNFFKAAPIVTSFESCVTAGYRVMESYPRQCKTPDGKTFTESIKINYSNATADLITVSSPAPGSVVGSNFSATGTARGTWYFEASFPVLVLDNNGAVIFQGPAQAQSDWMTTEFVPFKIDIKLPKAYSGSATLVLKKDNPSGLSDKEANISFPIIVSPK